MPSPIDDFHANNEPIDGATLVDPGKKFSPACLAAMREFRSKKPWRGTVPEREAKFTALHAALCDDYGIVPPPELRFLEIGVAREEQTGTSAFDRRQNALVLVGRLSVASYL